jgi:anti-sigma regulatory factor (Ser/Thr protein kinase)
VCTSTRPAQPRRGFAHTALLYHSQEEFLDGVLGFTEAAVAASQPAVVAVPPERHAVLKGRLHPAVELWDVSEVGRNPTSVIGAFTEKLRTSGGRAYLVGEWAWPGRSPEELAEVIVHEALCNVAFEGGSVVGLCPYDAATLDAELIARIRLTHPYIANGRSLSAGSSRGHENTDYMGQTAARSWRPPLPDPPPRATCLNFDLSNLRDVRVTVADQAARAHVSDERRADLVLAVNELATNSIRHAGGRGELRTWRTGDRLTIEVRDRGEIDDPLAGRISPNQHSTRGRGLWLVNRLCQLVQIRSGGEGTVVRVHEDVP